VGGGGGGGDASRAPSWNYSGIQFVPSTGTLVLQSVAVQPPHTHRP